MAAVVAAAAVMGGIQILQGLQRAEAIRANARVTQRINEINASNIEIDAYEEEKFGYTQLARYQTQVDQVMAKQESLYAYQNVDITSGTAKQLIDESRLNAFLNTLDIQTAARKRALGLKVQAGNVRLGGYLSGISSEAAADSAVMSGVLGATATGARAYADYNSPGKGGTPASSNKATVMFNDGPQEKTYIGYDRNFYDANSNTDY